MGLDCLPAGGSKQMILTLSGFGIPYAVKSNALSCPSPIPNASLQTRPSKKRPLNLESGLLGLLALGNARLGLDAHDATTPLLAGVLVLLEISLLDGRDELGQLVLVLGADLGQGEDSGGLEKGVSVNV